MGYLKGKANSKIKTSVDDFEEIKGIVMMEEIPASVILN